MILRIAKPEDAGELARVYYACNETNDLSFMSKLGPKFIREYYRSVLGAPAGLGICAVAPDGSLMGFATGTLNSAEQMARLRKARCRLFYAALGPIVREPSLIRRMLVRSSTRGNAFIVTEGARWDYWAWDPAHKVVGGALILQRCWLDFAKQLGAMCVSIEVNRAQKETIKLHELSGARLQREIETPEGLNRVIMTYDL